MSASRTTPFCHAIRGADMLPPHCLYSGSFNSTLRAFSENFSFVHTKI
jgi:hypothetical protein